MIFHLILGGRGEPLLRKPDLFSKGVKVPGNCSGSTFCPDQVPRSKEFPSETTGCRWEILSKDFRGWGAGMKI